MVSCNLFLPAEQLTLGILLISVHSFHLNGWTGSHSIIATVISHMSPKIPCVKGLIPEWLSWEVVEPFKVRSSGQSLGHWGMPLKGTVGSWLLLLPLFQFQSTRWAVLLCRCAPTMICCLTTDPKPMGPIDYELKYSKLWTKINL